MSESRNALSLRLRFGLPLLAGPIALAMAPVARADTDTPAFDRPGIAFSTGTLPRGGVAWEQGLPDFQRNRDDGVRTTELDANTNLRIGLSERVEVQLSGSLYSHLRVRSPTGTTTDHGGGDTGVALKIALPSSSQRFSWAVLGGVTFDTGTRAFSAGDNQYALGTTLAYDFSDTVSGDLYLNVSRLDGVDTYAWSPAVNVALGDRWGAYVEAGFQRTEGQATTAVAGGGVTWMATPRVQLDLSLDAGLDDRSPDVQGGFGVSVYFD